MAFKHPLILILLIFLVGCAQVGTITGGPKDENPPRIKKSSIQNGTTNFHDQKIEITFDEFIQLNKPTENIFLVPQDAKVESQLSKKTLRLSFSNELQKNTTYTLYLNAAVKDVSEGNDSLMQITFSTGSQLDSLRLQAIVVDAFSNQVKSKIVVGLFDSINAEKPKYFSQSDNAGVAKLTSLKQGNYYCKAFLDKNNDLIIQKDEIQDHIFQPIQLDTRFIDTLKLRISTPKVFDKIKNVQIVPPGLIAAHVPASRTIESIKINGIESKNYFYPKKDSLVISIGKLTENTLQLVLDVDTFQLNYTKRDMVKPFKAKYIESDNGNTSDVKLRFNDFVKSMDEKRIAVLNQKDSSEVAFEVFPPNNVQILLKIKDEKAKQLYVVLKDSAVLFESEKYNSPEKILVNLREERELGSINVKFSKSLNFGVLQILQKGNVIKEETLDYNTKAMLFSSLLPGEYSFRFIADTNQDGEWTPIDVASQTKAEEVIYFSTPIKVRANWEVETTLEFR